MWTVARWEFVQNLKSKAFLIATFVAPIFSLSLIALVIVIARTAERSPETRLAVIDRAGVFAELSEQLRGSDYKIVLFNSSESELPARMQRGEFDGYLVIESDFFETRQARYVPKSRQGLGINIQELRSQGVPRPVREALSQIVLRHELQQLGLSPRARSPAQPRGSDHCSSCSRSRNGAASRRGHRRRGVCDHSTLALYYYEFDHVDHVRGDLGEAQPCR
jgi:ABC-type Na+ efflux pump permease subunit